MLVKNLDAYVLADGGLDMNRLCLDVRPEIEKACKKFCRSYRSIAYDDAISDANFFLVTQLHTFDPSKGKAFTNWLYFKVYHRLLDKNRAIQNTLTRTESNDALASMTSRYFSFGQFKRDLPTEDARRLAHVAISEGVSHKDRLMSIMAGWGWSAERTAYAFGIVAAALYEMS
jgi:hypothetical protein